MPLVFLPSLRRELLIFSTLLPAFGRRVRVERKPVRSNLLLCLRWVTATGKAPLVCRSTICSSALVLEQVLCRPPENRPSRCSECGELHHVLLVDGRNRFCSAHWLHSGPCRSVSTARTRLLYPGIHEFPRRRAVDRPYSCQGPGCVSSEVPRGYLSLAAIHQLF